MNTPAHILVGAAAFGRHRSLIWFAVFGAVLPDLSLYLLAGTSLFLLQIPADVVFGELYFSSAWQTVFAIDNSAIVWGALLAVAAWQKAARAVALCAAALLHIALDFPLHHDDGRPHFWPATSWVFESPLSYWDRAHGARWIAPLEAMICAGAALLLWRARMGWGVTVLAAVLLAAELWIVRTWLFVF